MFEKTYNMLIYLYKCYLFILIMLSILDDKKYTIVIKRLFCFLTFVSKNMYKLICNMYIKNK